MKNIPANTVKYDRGGGLVRRARTSATNKRLNADMKRMHKLDKEAAHRLARAEVLLPDEQGFLEVEDHEASWKVRQTALAEEVEVGAAKKAFDFKLPLGPYRCSFSRNGRSLAVGGARGHLAKINLHSMTPSCEFHVKEDVRAIQSLHNELMFAVAQKKYAYIYDNKGVEMHCMRDHRYVTAMDFLPYHFLLVTGSDYGHLRYHDISIGKLVCTHKASNGRVRAMRQNRQNAVMHVGTSKGVVSLWTPNVKEPVLSLFCHKGDISALDVHRDYMVTTGSDGHWKVWDLRMNRRLHTFSYFGATPDALDVSMTGLVALGFGCHTQIWKEAFATAKPTKPYLAEDFAGRHISSLRFQPYEDVCVVGHSGGVTAMLVPGAGAANFDTHEDNPYETKKQRQDQEVKRLLEKLSPDMIALESAIGAIAKASEPKPGDVLHEETKDNVGEAASRAKKEKKEKRKQMRGKGKVGKRLQKKEKTRGVLQRENKRASASANSEAVNPPGASAKEPAAGRPASAASGALSRFWKKVR